MTQVLDKVSEVERSGQQTVAALATLDAVKTRMEECAQMLAEMGDAQANLRRDTRDRACACRPWRCDQRQRVR